MAQLQLSSHHQAPSPGKFADDQDEILEIVDEDQRVVGTAPRRRVHADGLLHRAAYCFVFNQAGELLIQRRSLRKRIGAGLWDISLAEHLSPGETYDEAVIRGLREELSISARAVEGPLGTTHRRSLQEAGMFRDEEFVQAFCLRGYSGAVQPDAAEVEEVAFVPLQDLLTRVHERPEEYTPWLKEQLTVLAARLPGLAQALSTRTAVGS